MAGAGAVLDERHILRMKNKSEYLKYWVKYWNAYTYVKEINFNLILTTLFWISVTQAEPNPN